MERNLPTVSVIVPVYNAASTLLTSLHSLKEQTYSLLEIVLINDASTDTSLHVLQQFAVSSVDREGMTIKIFSHEQNLGVASARNTGLEQATGTYIFYVDSDDWIAPNAIELTVNKAMETDADIVGFNWCLSFEKNERVMNQPNFSDPIEAIKKILAGGMRWNLWLFLTKRSLYEKHKLRFLDGMNMGEDLLMMIKLFSCSRKVSFLDIPLYHYGQSNGESLTKTYSPKHIQEVSHHIAEVETVLLTHGLMKDIGDGLFFLKLNIKLPMLISPNVNQYKKWITWFPEANTYIAKNKVWPWRIRFIQQMAIKKQYWVLRLYYYLVVRLVYGVIYK